MPALLVCPALTPADFAAVRGLNDTCLEVQYGDDFYQDLQRGSSLTLVVKMLLTPEEEKQGLQVQPCQGTIVGALTARLEPPARDNPLAWFLSLLSVYTSCYVMSLAVSPAVRRQGVAALLLQSLRDLLEREYDCSIIELHCLHSNTAAQRLYEKQGYRKLQFLPQYYWLNGEHAGAYHMRAELRRPLNRRQLLQHCAQRHCDYVLAACSSIAPSCFCRRKRAAGGDGSSGSSSKSSSEGMRMILPSDRLQAAERLLSESDPVSMDKGAVASAAAPAAATFRTTAASLPKDGEDVITINSSISTASSTTSSSSSSSRRAVPAALRRGDGGFFTSAAGNIHSHCHDLSTVEEGEEES